MKGQLFSMDFVVSVGVLGVVLAVALHAAHFSQSFDKPSDKAFAVSEALLKGKVDALSIPASDYGYRYSLGPITSSTVVLEHNFVLSCANGVSVARRIGPCPATGNTCIIDVRVCA